MTHPIAQWSLPLFVLLSLVPTVRSESPSSPQQMATRFAIAPDRAIVLRLSEELFQPEEGSEVNELTPVDRYVLGTRVVGQCRMTGNIKIDFLPDPDDGSFQLVFDGACRSRTVSRNGPAQIHNSSVTQFRCTKRISFDLEKGFHAMPSQVATSTQLWNERIETSRRGPLGRIVRNVASRRVAESLPQARTITNRDTQRDIANGFDKTIDAQLLALNQRLDTTRVLAAMLGAATQRSVCIRSNNKYLEICFNDGTLGEAEYLTIPDEKVADAPIEIWASSSLFDSRLRTMFNAFAIAASVVQRGAPQSDLAESMANVSSALTLNDVNMVDGWFVFGVNRETPVSARLASFQR